MELPQLIEALLFHQAEPMEIHDLAKALERKEGEVRDALGVLEEGLKTHGMRLLRVNTSVTLATMPEASALIERLLREEREKELGKAALETLAIVLYQGPVTRSAIDHIRGVNSTFILRNLQIRGLVERIPHPTDQRSFLYRPTTDLLRYLGVAKIEDLPSYTQVIADLEALNTISIAQESDHEDGAPSSTHTTENTDTPDMPAESVSSQMPQEGNS